MDAQQFLAEFGHIASAPEGVQRLRAMVLSLAMQGKLVPQFPNESSADVLLQQVDADRKRVIKSGVIKSHRTLPEVSANDVTHSLPATWTWVRFGEIALHNSGKTLDSMRNSGQPRDYITTSNLYWGRFELGNVRKMLIRDEELEKCTARKNDLLICEGGEAGRAAVWNFDSEVCFQNHIHRARFFGEINPFFAYRFFEKLNSTGEINQHRKGIGISNMSSKALAMIPFPLPPVKEQARIVAKVDELMTLCEKLETQQQEKRTGCAKAREVAIQELVNSESPHAFQEAWNRIQANLNLLLDNPSAANELKLAIRELAVRGFLSIAVDDSVDSFLMEIQAKKTGKRFAKLTTPAEEFSLPQGWRWVLLEDLLSGSDSGWSPKCDPESRRDTEWGVLKVSAVTWGKFKSEENKKLPLSLKARPEFEVSPGNFLLSRANTADLVARSVIVPKDCPPRLMMSDKIVRLDFIDDRVKPWLNLVNNSAWARAYYKKYATGTSDSMRNVSRQVINELAIPLPPLKLQNKLLEVLHGLEDYCDSLAKKFEERDKTAAQLAKASTSSITGIRIEEEEKLKAPKTELISKLCLGDSPGIKEQAPLAAILARQNGEMASKDLWQRFGGEIDAFYTQLKLEVSRGWILKPAIAEMREVEAG